MHIDLRMLYVSSRVFLQKSGLYPSSVTTISTPGSTGGKMMMMINRLIHRSGRNSRIESSGNREIVVDVAEIIK